MLRKFALLFGAQIIFGGLLLVNNIILARVLGPAGRGMVALLVGVPMVTVMLTNLGFQFSAPYFISRGEAAPQVVFGTVFALTTAMSCVFAVIAMLFWQPIAGGVYQNLPPLGVALSLASLPALFIVFYLEAVWVALDAIRVSVAARMAQSIVYVVSTVVLVATLKLGAVGGIAAFTAGAWAAALLVIVAAVRLAGPPAFDRSVLRRGMKFGLTAYVGYLTDHVTYRADTFVLTYMSGFQQLGYYAFGQPLAELIWYLSNSVKPVLFTRVAATSEEDVSITPTIVRMTLSLAVIMGVGIFIGAVLIVRFYLTAFRPALPPLAVLLCATVIAVVFQLLLSDVTARGQAARASGLSLMVVPVALGLYFALIPPFGALGAAVGSLISYSLLSGLALFSVRRTRGFSPWEVLRPRLSDYTAVMARFRRLLQETRSA